MKTLKRFLFITLIVALGSCYPNKYEPQIISVEANPESVLVGESVSLSCVASDGDNDILTYSWTSVEGEFPNGSTGSTVIWKAPVDSGSYQIMVDVTDDLCSTTDFVDVHVFKEHEYSGSFEYEGREYEFTTIGSQTWMIENLAYLPKVDEPLFGGDYEPHYYVYGYEGLDVSIAKERANYEKWGVLYNWEAAIRACPLGWHLPSDDEWKTLEKNQGMLSSEADDTDWRDGGSVGKKLKSTSEWYHDGNGNNSSRFNAKPGGLKSYSGLFSDITQYGNYWSSTPNEDFDAWYRYLGYPEDGINRNTSSRRRGFSVRCVRD